MAKLPLLSLLWNQGGSDEDDIEPKKQTKTQAPEQVKQTSVSKMVGRSSEKMRKHLVAVIEEADLPGFDYLEFLQVMKESEEDVPDENARMKAAMAAAKSMKVSPSQIIEAAEHYLKALSDDRKNFENEIAQTGSGEIDDKKKEIADIDKTVSHNRKEIERLTDEIAKAEVLKQNLLTEVSSAESKFGQRHAEYEAAYSEITAGIKNDIKKIKTTFGVKA